MQAQGGLHGKVRIGSQVVGPDGQEQIGTVEKVVISPQTREVTHLLVHRGPLQLLHHDVMVPIASVSAVSEAAVQLSVLVETLNRMPAHDAAGYVDPATSWPAPEGYRRDQVLFALPDRTGSLDQLLPRSQGRAQDTRTEAQKGVLIGTSTKVEASDGPIGVIDRVLLDPDSGRATHFVVRKGKFLAKHVIVPADWASEITPEKVRLAVDREQLTALPEYKPDDEIAEGVLEALRSYPPLRRLVHGIALYEPVLSPYERDTVRVMVQDGIVILEGNVQTSGHKSMAVWLAQQVPGVRRVRNLLVADDDLEIEISSALSRDPRTRGVQARVGSLLGIVTIKGKAPSEEARTAAQSVASQIPGVRTVVNQLRVQPD
jgi:uncharacterized protein YrrD